MTIAISHKNLIANNQSLGHILIVWVCVFLGFYFAKQASFVSCAFEGDIKKNMKDTMTEGEKNK